ncbi:MAG: hypothetical protein OSB25_05080 [Salibacteraceae bacterium]|nr:hypothetical protein [Salibacteraceae bacterium]|tara:strand:+ start:14721 stop:15104 length:384 start_codon:yes stop_codon:yes gene_type:complete
MRAIITTILMILAAFIFSTGHAQVNLKPMEDKGFVIKKKFKSYKKTKSQVLKLKIKNVTEKHQELNFQLYLYVNGIAESMSEEKSECLAPKKKVKYRFLFKPENIGDYSVELEKFDVKEVDTCSPAK